MPRSLSLVLIAFGLLGCGKLSHESVPDNYVHLALALGERDPDSLDFSAAPIAWIERGHRDYISYDAIDQGTTAALERLARAKNLNPDSATALRQQINSIRARTAMLRGHVLPFDQEAVALFGVTRQSDTSAEERVALRHEIADQLARLPEAPRKGTLAQRYDAWNERFLIPRDRTIAVLQKALDVCRTATLQHISLPAGETITITPVRDKPWAAFSQYLGNGHSTLFLNMDLALTVDDALELGCHEGYPGHHVFNLLRDQALVQHDHRAEAELQLTFSPQGFWSEAAAAAAPRLAMSEDQRIAVERDVLFPAAGLPSANAAAHVHINNLVRRLDTAQPAIAKAYLDGELEFVRAEDAFADEMLMAHAEQTLLYLNEYRSYGLAYTQGAHRVEQYLAAPAPRSTPAELQQLDAAWARYRALAEQWPGPVAHF
ncbi:hypothetical protein SAMN05421819_2621 [Bryocella elongata]|uniref:DUF885 domain-containing protein n=1 Tax=Bryocella elongata TaxID=863522 RepID=A0A1H5ZFT9_9BACT|nr:hypothetical protein [Bryocella elongata]SEG34914.1 hypothetical protein SAMN05421819_2621 [Bryocella elongata]